MLWGISTLGALAVRVDILLLNLKWVGIEL